MFLLLKPLAVTAESDNASKHFIGDQTLERRREIVSKSSSVSRHSSDQDIWIRDWRERILVVCSDDECSEADEAESDMYLD